MVTLAYLNGVPYLGGTTVPIASRFGGKTQLIHLGTQRSVLLNRDGTAVLEPGTAYEIRRQNHSGQDEHGVTLAEEPFPDSFSSASLLRPPAINVLASSPNSKLLGGEDSNSSMLRKQRSFTVPDLTTLDKATEGDHRDNGENRNDSSTSLEHSETDPSMQMRRRANTATLRNSLGKSVQKDELRNRSRSLTGWMTAFNRQQAGSEENFMSPSGQLQASQGSPTASAAASPGLKPDKSLREMFTGWKAGRTMTLRRGSDAQDPNRVGRSRHMSADSVVPPGTISEKKPHRRIRTSDVFGRGDRKTVLMDEAHALSSSGSSGDLNGSDSTIKAGGDAGRLTPISPSPTPSSGNLFGGSLRPASILIQTPLSGSSPGLDGSGSGKGSLGRSKRRPSVSSVENMSPISTISSVDVLRLHELKEIPECNGHVGVLRSVAEDMHDPESTIEEEHEEVFERLFCVFKDYHLHIYSSEKRDEEPRLSLSAENLTAIEDDVLLQNEESEDAEESPFNVPSHRFALIKHHLENFNEDEVWIMACDNREDKLRWMATINSACVNMDLYRLHETTGIRPRSSSGAEDSPSENASFSVASMAIAEIPISELSEQDRHLLESARELSLQLRPKESITCDDGYVIEIDALGMDQESWNHEKKKELKTNTLRYANGRTLVRKLNEGVYNYVLRYEVSDDGKVTDNILGGTLDKLLELLAYERSTPTEYISTFLLAYRHVIEPLALMKGLTRRFNLVIPPEASASEQESLKSQRDTIRTRVALVVRRWIEQYVFDFLDEPLEQALRAFLFLVRYVDDTTEKHKTEFRKLSYAIQWIFESKKAAYIRDRSNFLLARPPPKLQVTMLDFDYHDLAQQLTMIEEDLFRKLKPFEFLVQLWGYNNNTEDEAYLKRHLSECTARFNKISYWVATEICTQPEIKNRVIVVRKVIKLAEELRKMNNYNDLLAVVSGINVSSVQRLKETWKEVQPKHKELLKNLETLVSPEHNYGKYRTLIQQFNANEKKVPFIPFYVLFLKDLVFINDGNAKFLDDGMINFTKLRMIYARTMQLLSRQGASYNFNRSSAVGEESFGGSGSSGPASAGSTASATCATSSIVEYCTHLRCLGEEALYKYSLLCEPKAGGEGRLLSKWTKENQK